MPTLSANVCRCGTDMEYQGPNKDTLHCPHCDEPCRIQQDTGETCERCSDYNHFWKRQVI